MRTVECAAGCGRELATFNDNPDAVVLCHVCHPSDLSAVPGVPHDRDQCDDCQRLIAAGRIA